MNVSNESIKARKSVVSGVSVTITLARKSKKKSVQAKASKA